MELIGVGKMWQLAWKEYTGANNEVHTHTMGYRRIQWGTHTHSGVHIRTVGYIYTHSGVIHQTEIPSQILEESEVTTTPKLAESRKQSKHHLHLSAPRQEPSSRLL